MQLNEQHKEEVKKQGSASFLTIAVLFLIVAVITFFIFTASVWNDSRVIKKIEITGGTEITRNALTDALKLSVINKSKSEIELHSLEKIARKDPFVKSACAYFESNDKVHIRLESRCPAAICITENGTKCIIDVSSAIIRWQKEYERIGLPVFKNFFSNKKLLKSPASQALKLMNNLLNYGLKSDWTAEVHYQKESGEVVFITNDGIKINFGRIDNSDNKIDRLMKASAISNKSQSKFIDLRWQDRVILN